MELRELKYFLTIAHEGSISKAADVLYITQPSLSRQMQNLEKEIGKQLFVRGNKKITLTETGELLQKRAEEMLSLYDKTQAEIAAPCESVYGDIYIGGGESYAISAVAKAAKKLLGYSNSVRFHFYSGDTMEVAEKLDKGLIDFAVLVEPADLSKYNYLRLPQKDTWGVLMRKDSPLAAKDYITPKDLQGLPLIRSKHAINQNELSDWFKQDGEYNIVATYNLLYNASLLVKEGIGYAVGLDGIINTTGDSMLTFRPLMPRLESTLAVAWKKNQVFSKAAEKFLEVLNGVVENH
ncbi:MAG: LysR family transcriptional regulator [Clostridia bacterium]|nr:LysR family transcriptional regulator [Clostridia bacterium]